MTRHFSSDNWIRLNEKYEEAYQELQKLWLAADQQYMEDAFM